MQIDFTNQIKLDNLDNLSQEKPHNRHTSERSLPNPARIFIN